MNFIYKDIDPNTTDELPDDFYIQAMNYAIETMKVSEDLDERNVMAIGFINSFKKEFIIDGKMRLDEEPTRYLMIFGEFLNSTIDIDTLSQFTTLYLNPNVKYKYDELCNLLTLMRSHRQT